MYMSLVTSGNTIIVKDDKDRVLLNVKGNDIALARFPDLDEEIKNNLADIYSDLTGKNKDNTKQFLNYETDENEFCS